MKTYKLKNIAELCNVGEGAILAFIKYCLEEGKEIPNPIPYQRSYYTYTEEDGKKIAEMFKNKKRGEMANYNYRHNWGSKYRSKYPHKQEETDQTKEKNKN